MSAPGGADLRGQQASDELYARCPDCGFIAPPESADYGVTANDAIDWSRPACVTCMVCRAYHDVTVADVLQADAEMACKRCMAAVAYPAAAARVRCTGCGLFLIGPGLSEAQRGELRIAEGLADLALRETYLAATRRGGRRAGQ